MTRTERWKAKREAAKKEMYDFDAYIERLEDENDKLHQELNNALIQIKELEYDKDILEIKLRMFEHGKE